ncbi:unnamed protein product, partial [Cylicostephanus goldi]
MGEIILDGDTKDKDLRSEDEHIPKSGAHPVRIVEVVEDVDHSFELNVAELEK